MLFGLILFGLGLAAGLFFYNYSLCWARRIPHSEEDLEGPAPAASPAPASASGTRPHESVPIFKEALSGGPFVQWGPGVSPLPSILTALFTASLYLLTYSYTSTFGDLLKLLVLFSLLLIISLIDLKRHIIPNTLVLAVLAWGVFWQIINPPVTWPLAFLGLLLGGGFLFLAAVISRGGMGGGDIKLMLAAGFYLGPALTAQALFIAVFAGALVGLLLLLFRIKKRKDPIPFGPFLCFGIITALLFGPQIF